MKLLVTGALGFIGYEVARQLSVNGYRPRLMIRQPGDDCEICDFDADIVLANLRDHRSLKQAVNGVEGIIHLAARATFESYQTLKPSILDGSLALMQAGVATDICCFVYSSSLFVYRGSRSMVDAHTPANPAIDYGRIKVETEKRLLKIARSAGISFSALRLPHVYGMRDLYFQQLQAGRLILPGLGKNTCAHLHVADAAAVIIACAEQAFEGILPVGDHRPSTWNAFLRIARQHFTKARIIRLPHWLALLATALLTPFRRTRPHPGLETRGTVRTYNFLRCPKCQSQMRIIAFIEDDEVIKKILKHLDLWDKKARPPPKANSPPMTSEYHIDYTDSQLPVSDNYLYMDPVYSESHSA